ncbi:hypothetical protein M917_2769 [Psychrobacter aquaticus CMS 56]|uniref:Uncharacterized protein n=1 Tax=Psychrobacter aquaticus CMS 56 TaxID=1354303 RepID=U4T3J4_9GAMM|nr:hypothetical protein M917_2769 [Psychrobacter aquaticus CMS 56]
MLTLLYYRIIQVYQLKTLYIHNNDYIANRCDKDTYDDIIYTQSPFL